MTVIRAIFGWFFRQGLLLCLIVAAILFYQIVWPMVLNGAAKAAISDGLMSPGDISVELARLRKQTILDFEVSKKDIRSSMGNALKVTLREKRQHLIEVEDRLKQKDVMFASIRPSAIIEKERLKLKRTIILSEIDLLKAATKKEAIRTALMGIAYPTRQAVSTQKSLCATANQNVRNFNRLSAVKKAVENLRFAAANKLTERAKVQCKSFTDKSVLRAKGLKSGREARRKFEQSKAALSQVEREVTNQLGQHSLDVGKPTVQTLIKQALIILTGIILLPFVIRTFFYYVLAPLAERRAHIRIKAPDHNAATIPMAEHSRISIPIALQRGEELLVRQNYLQASSLTGKKDTRWVLDYRHVLSSIASGLTFLTRIRGEGETTTVSAVHDGFAELGDIALPIGVACVLHPRALVALVQPVGQTMRITSHWRLFSLNAWLTFQLRYLVFHGPVRLVVKGGRGIRVERAERGRIFGQDQLVGFSSDIAYSIIRTETFAPYFFGREQLFKDKVESGCGILIIEEAPFSSRDRLGIRRGLEGAVDAGMKAFGL